MTDALNEQLSALLDGELPPGESELVLKRLERNPQLRETLSRYALIGEAMRATEPVVAAPPGFASRISQALAQEAPAAEVAVRAPARRSSPRWWRPAAGLGVAAAVSAIALGIIGRDPAAPQPAPAATVAASSAPVAPAARVPQISDLLPAPARVSVARAGGSGEPQSYVTPQPVPGVVPLRPPSEFANYVVAHAEYSSPLGRRAVLSGLVGENAQADPAVVTLEPRTESLFAIPRASQSGAMPPSGNSGR